MKTLLAILLVVTITLSNSHAQQNFKIPIKLVISGKTGLEGQVRSYFNREFRAIGDVEVNGVITMRLRSRSFGERNSPEKTDRLPCIDR